MSRIGKLKIVKLDNVEIMFDKNSGEVQVKGPKGVLRDTFLNGFNLIQDDKVLHVEIEKKDDSNVEKVSAFQGLYRALLQNMIDGVTKGFSKKLELIGVGYKASMTSANVLELDLGFSHKVLFVLPTGISCTVNGEKGKNIIVVISGNNKCLVGQIASNLRMLRPVDPYKGKGFRYVGEVVRLKAGKTVSSKK
ncbi:MAG: 50S ribosomal protein L6 [Cytophagales bacterium]|nr:50S ribosomal protein L6 [Cytophagales bacterium]